MFSSLLVLTFIAVTAFAKPVTHELVQHESRQSIPRNFAKVNAARTDLTLTLRIGLVQNNIAGLHKAVYDVSTPGSPLYGQHLSRDEVKAFVVPSSETVSLVNEWLSANDILAKPISSAGDWLEFTVPVSKANTMLGADFHVFSHTPTGKELVRTLAYSIPTNLKNHIEVIHPTTSFDVALEPGPVAQAVNPIPHVSETDPRDVDPSSVCNAAAITPACILALYKIPATSASIFSNNELAVTGFGEQFAQITDFNIFLKNFRSDLSGSQFTQQFVDNGTNPQDPTVAGSIANIDVQYAVGIGGVTTTSFVSAGSQNKDGGLNGFLDVVQFELSARPPPSVLSTTYGFNEQDISAAMANSLCNAYAQLTVQGTSIIFSSGDGGVSGIQPSDECSVFIPTFPSGCQFVTSVGATSGVSTEISASFSSGGFSNIFPQPTFQSISGAVQGYLNILGSTNEGRYNTSGRGYPDVAAQGVNIATFNGGLLGTFSGTSPSASIFASMIALINSNRISRGKSVLGLLNPMLYSASASSTFTDITRGNNPGCNSNGFPAAKGWDPVTGLGTPNFQKLLAVLS